LALPIILFSCKSTKLVKEGEHLLTKNKVVYEKSNDHLSGVEAQIKHKPNRRILGTIRFHLSVYNIASSKRDSIKNSKNRVKRYFRKHVGESPVKLDSGLVNNSAKNIQDYLVSKGYFDIQVTPIIQYHRKKRAMVTYKINRKGVYKYDSILYNIPDERMSYLFKNEYKSYLAQGSSVDFDVLNKERNDFSNYVKNTGFFYFKRDFITYELDTLRAFNKAKIKMSIVNKPQGKLHTRCNINSIHFIINGKDTFSTNIDTSFYKGVLFTKNLYKINSSILYKYCSIKLDSLYSTIDETKTYSELSSLNLFDFIDIRYYPLYTDSSKLNTVINLSTGFQSFFSIEPQTITTDDADIIETNENRRNYGIANTITFTLKNAFRNAEQLDLSATTSIQAQGNNESRIYNSFNQSITAALNIPESKFLGNWALRNEYGNVKTSISATYLYENNLDFSRKILSSKFGYKMSKKRHSYFFTPLEVSYSRSDIKSNIFDTLTNLDLKEFYTRLFDPNLITNSSLGYIFSNNKNNGRSYFYIRSKILETGGLTHRAIRTLLDTKNEGDTSFNLLGVHYFQYLKSDIDVRYNWIVDNKNAIVFRGNVGIGLPYWNSNVLPYEKRFFIGGANNLRGWRPRTVGPGTAGNSVTQLDRTGELMVVFNTEYRFQLIKKYVESAIFFDMGNVWNVRENDQKVKGYFDFRNMISDMALNTGVGMRFDFQFFMMRLDWGIRLKDPSLSSNEKWVVNQKIDGAWVNQNSVLNLGIGYPF
jgi:hypothetical protein